jgi:hypothetical protein
MKESAALGGAMLARAVRRCEVSVEVRAPVERVWRALCYPPEVVRWDAGVAAAIDAPADYPRPGQRVRWRCRGGPFPVLVDEPREVAPSQRLRSFLRLGPFRYDETYRLEPALSGCRLTAIVGVWTALPVVGHLIDRLYLAPATRRALATSLAALKRHCESEP